MNYTKQIIINDGGNDRFKFTITYGTKNLLFIIHTNYYLMVSLFGKYNIRYNDNNNFWTFDLYCIEGVNNFINAMSEINGKELEPDTYDRIGLEQFLEEDIITKNK